MQVSWVILQTLFSRRSLDLLSVLPEDDMFEGLFQPMHLLVILFIALLIFGPKKLRNSGKGWARGRLSVTYRASRTVRVSPEKTIGISRRYCTKTS